MKALWNDFIALSSVERKGIVILILIILMITGAKLWIVLRDPEPLTAYQYDWMADTVSIARAKPDIQPDIPDDLPVKLPQSFETFRFDPNTVTYKQLLRLGIGDRAASNLIKYRTKGGKFRKPADLKKIYGVSPEVFKRLEGYILIEVLPAAAQDKRLSHIASVVDINAADTLEFGVLPGIGPVLASRIVKYRGRLGGYINTLQIKEVYGISDSLFIQIRNRLVADTAKIIKINLNTASEKELSRHPYIGRYVARGIVQYRAQVREIKTLDELQKQGLIRQDILEKLRGYLSI